MEITIYRRHSADCKHKDDRYHPRCGCSLWFQFNWTQPETTWGGNKLRQGQNKWSAETRIWSEAQTNVKRLKTDLEALLDGRPARQSVTVKAAVNTWLEFRNKNGITSKKGRLMGEKLVAWCEKNDVGLLTAITTQHVMEFRIESAVPNGRQQQPVGSLGGHRRIFQLGCRYGLHRKKPNSEYSAVSAVPH